VLIFVRHRSCSHWGRMQSLIYVCLWWRSIDSVCRECWTISNIL